MDDFEKEVMWADSTTGDSFQCVHVDYARELKAEIDRLRAALTKIANDDLEPDDWNDVDGKSGMAWQNVARRALLTPQTIG